VNIHKRETNTLDNAYTDTTFDGYGKMGGDPEFIEGTIETRSYNGSGDLVFSQDDPEDFELEYDFYPTGISNALTPVTLGATPLVSGMSVGDVASGTGVSNCLGYIAYYKIDGTANGGFITEMWITIEMEDHVMSCADHDGDGIVEPANPGPPSAEYYETPITP